MNGIQQSFLGFYGKNFSSKQDKREKQYKTNYLNKNATDTVSFQGKSRKENAIKTGLIGLALAKLLSPVAMGYAEPNPNNNVEPTAYVQAANESQSPVEFDEQGRVLSEIHKTEGKDGITTIASSKYTYNKDGSTVKITTLSYQKGDLTWEDSSDPVVQITTYPNGNSEELHYIISQDRPFYSKRITTTGKITTITEKEDEAAKYFEMGHPGKTSKKVTTMLNGRVLSEKYESSRNTGTQTSEKTGYRITYTKAGNTYKSEYVTKINDGEFETDEGPVRIEQTTTKNYTNNKLKSGNINTNTYINDRLASSVTKTLQGKVTQSVQYGEPDKNGIMEVRTTLYTYKTNGTVLERTSITKQSVNENVDYDGGDEKHTIEKTTYPNGKIVEKEVYSDGNIGGKSYIIETIIEGKTKTVKKSSHGAAYDTIEKYVNNELKEKVYISKGGDGCVDTGEPKGSGHLVRYNDDGTTTIINFTAETYDEVVNGKKSDSDTKDDITTDEKNNETKEATTEKTPVVEEKDPNVKYDKKGRVIQKTVLINTDKNGERTYEVTDIKYLSDGSTKEITHIVYGNGGDLEWEKESDPVVQIIKYPDGSSSEIHYTSSSKEPFYSKEVKITGNEKVTTIKENESARYGEYGHHGTVSEKVTVEKNGKLVSETYKENNDTCTQYSYESGYKITVDENGNRRKEAYDIRINDGEFESDEGSVRIEERKNSTYINDKLVKTNSTTSYYTNNRLTDTVIKDSDDRVIQKNKYGEENKKGEVTVETTDITYLANGEIKEVTYIHHDGKDGMSWEASNETVVTIIKRPDGSSRETRSTDSGIYYTKEVEIKDGTIITTINDKGSPDIDMGFSGPSYKKVVVTDQEGNIISEKYDSQTSNCITGTKKSGYEIKIDENGDEIKTEYSVKYIDEIDSETGECTDRKIEIKDVYVYKNGELISSESFKDGERVEDEADTEEKAVEKEEKSNETQKEEQLIEQEEKETQTEEREEEQEEEKAVEKEEKSNETQKEEQLIEQEEKEAQIEEKEEQEQEKTGEVAPIDWESFNTDTSRVDFGFNAAQQTTLNRTLGDKTSEIVGQFQGFETPEIIGTSPVIFETSEEE